MEVGRPRGGNNPTVCMEELRETLNLPPETLRYHLLPGNQNDPFTDHGIQHHVKYGVGEWIPLDDPLAAFEWVAIIAPYSGQHKEVLPIVPEVPLRHWYNPVADEYLQITLPIAGIAGILEVKGNLI